jgi:predicted RNA methylase
MERNRVYLVSAVTEEQAEAMRASLRGGVQTVSAPSLFETPPELICRMMDRAEIEAGHRVLEPSAGTGRLARAAFERSGAPVVCVEINRELCELLDRAGWIYWQGDFMEYEPPILFDRVVMNPPFEKGQDAEHVRRAFDLLAPGGRLVAITSPGPFFHESKKARAFREWFASVGGEMEELPAGSFETSGTGVASRLLVIDEEGF